MLAIGAALVVDSVLPSRRRGRRRDAGLRPRGRSSGRPTSIRGGSAPTSLGCDSSGAMRLLAIVAADPGRVGAGGRRRRRRLRVPAVPGRQRLACRGVARARCTPGGDVPGRHGRRRRPHADFGSGAWEGGPIGIPYTVIPAGQAGVPIRFGHAGDGDPGPYPIPPDAPVEGGPDAGGDRHVLVVQAGTCRLYELFDAHREGGGWRAGSGAVWDLRSNRLRPAGWTSADAAGLPILAGLVRYEEVARGVDHAIRVTVDRSQAGYLWPARHHAGQAGRRCRRWGCGCGCGPGSTSPGSPPGAGDPAGDAGPTGWWWPTTARRGSSAACPTSAGTTTPSTSSAESPWPTSRPSTRPRCGSPPPPPPPAGGRPTPAAPGRRRAGGGALLPAPSPSHPLPA